MMFWVFFGSSNLLHLTKEEEARLCAIPWAFQLESSHFLLWVWMKPNEKGWDGRKTKEKEVMHRVKTQYGLRFIAFRWEFIKRAEPVRVGGLADWIRTKLTGSRSPPPMITVVTAVCIRQAGAVLSRNAWGENDWLCLGVKVSLIIIVIITFLVLLLFISFFQLLLFKALVIFQGLSGEIQHCSGNYSLAEEVTNLKVCG